MDEESLLYIEVESTEYSEEVFELVSCKLRSSYIEVATPISFTSSDSADEVREVVGRMDISIPFLGGRLDVRGLYCGSGMMASFDSGTMESFVSEALRERNVGVRRLNFESVFERTGFDGRKGMLVRGESSICIVFAGLGGG